MSSVIVKEQQSISHRRAVLCAAKSLALHNGPLILGLFFLVTSTMFFTSRAMQSHFFILLVLPFASGVASQAIQVLHATGMPRHRIQRALSMIGFVQWLAVLALYIAFGPIGESFHSTLLYTRTSQLTELPSASLIITFAMLSAAVHIGTTSQLSARGGEQAAPWLDAAGMLGIFASYLVIATLGDDVMGAAVALAMAVSMHCWMRWASTIGARRIAPPEAFQISGYKVSDYVYRHREATIGCAIIATVLLVGCLVVARGQHADTTNAYWIAALVATGVGSFVSILLGIASHVQQAVAAGRTRRQLTTAVGLRIVGYAAWGTVLSASLCLTGHWVGTPKLIMVALAGLGAGFAAAWLTLVEQSGRRAWLIASTMPFCFYLLSLCIYPVFILMIPQSTPAMLASYALWPAIAGYLWFAAAPKVPLSTQIDEDPNV